ncbi:MAG: sodium:solute symporter family protein [Thermoprotei archaeon]|nr:MAG: sodium:solute symporter family protein [Thermoprotei archaeon]
MVGIGLWLAKRGVRTLRDYILAGGRLGTLIAGGTMIATWFGSGTVVGGPASLGYIYGLGPAIMFMLMPPIGIAILYLLSEKIRGMYRYTIPEIMESKLGVGGRIISAIIIIIAHVGIVSYQFIGLGYILNVTTGISTELGTIIGAIVIAALAVSGGLVSIAYTDAITAFLMLFSLVIGCTIAHSLVGGFAGAAAKVPPTHLTITGGMTIPALISTCLPLLLLLLGEMNMWQRVAAARESLVAKRAILMWLIAALIVGPLVSLMAFFARAYFPEMPAGMSVIKWATVMPEVLGAIFLAGVAGFIISTGNSYLLTPAMCAAVDIYKRVVRPTATEREVFIVTRAIVAAFAIFAYAIGMYFPSVLAIQMYSYTMIGAAITIVLLCLALIPEKITRMGGISGLITGAALTIIWDAVLARPYGIHAALISAPLALIVTIVGSLLTRSKA